MTPHIAMTFTPSLRRAPYATFADTAASLFFGLTMPRFKRPERKLQADVKDWAERTWGYKQKGKFRLVCIKLTMLGMMGQAGFPDLAFWCRSRKGRPFGFFIEMKKKGGEPTELQALRHSWLRALGWTVYVADSVEAAKQYISKEMEK